MDAKAYAARNRAGSDWFGHSDEKVSPLEETKAPLSESTQTGGEQVMKTALIKPVCNSNQWFRHEGDKADGAKAPAAAVAVETGAAPTEHHGDHLAHGDHHHHQETARSNGQVAAAGMVVGERREPMSAHNAEQRSNASREGEANCQRDKAGSDWFSHHDPTKPVANPRAGSAESSCNALKMRNESENWFSHDPKAPPEPLHPSKGRHTNTRGNKEMYNIFHHAG